MTASGYADLLGKVTSGADWLIADALEVEKIDPVRAGRWCRTTCAGGPDSPAELRAGDQQSTGRLMEGLILSGLGMQSYQSSRTASGAEHQFSHLWEMEGLGHGEGHSGTPSPTASRSGWARSPSPRSTNCYWNATWPPWTSNRCATPGPPGKRWNDPCGRSMRAPSWREGAVEQTLAKYISADELARRLELLRDVWPGLREKVRVQLMPAEQIREMLQAAGCPTGPVEIGLRWEDFEATYSRARTIRKRYTVLDLAFEAGILEECVDELFAPEGFWGRTAASQTRADGTRVVGSFRPALGRIMTTVSVLGSGLMATALAFPLSDNGHEVRLIGTHLDREIIDSIKERRVHPGLDLEVPRAVRAFQLEEAEEAFDGADVVMSGVNSFGVRWAGEHLARLLEPGMHVLSIAKGMEATESGDLRILPEVLAGEVPEDLREQVSWSAIAGPSIAGEVAVRRDTCVVFTGRDAGVLEEMAGLFRTLYYHVWTSTDLVGVEVCAAAKNCYALGAGFMEGILDREGESEAPYRNYNYGAALFGQATRELGRFMELLGGERETPYGLAGVGDMFVTSMGGRNVKSGAARRLGAAVLRGARADAWGDARRGGGHRGDRGARFRNLPGAVSSNPRTFR